MYQKSKCSPLSNKLNNNSCYNQRALKKIGKIYIMIYLIKLKKYLIVKLKYVG